jgi:uncharacterized membrane protein
MNKISAVIQLVRAGHSVADPVKWKTRQISATVLGAVILAIVNLANAFGVDIPVNIDTANAIAGGIIAIINVIFTLTTTDKIGLSGMSIEKNVIEMKSEDIITNNNISNNYIPEISSNTNVTNNTNNNSKPYYSNETNN